MWSITKGSNMQRQARRSSTRNQKLTHACRQVLIDQLENRVLLSTGGMPDPGFGQGGYVKGFEILAVQQDGSLIAQTTSTYQPAPLVLLHPDGSFESNYVGPLPEPAIYLPNGDRVALGIYNSTTPNSVTCYYGDTVTVDRSFGNSGIVTDFTSGTGYPAGAFIPGCARVVGNQIIVSGSLDLGDQQHDSVTALVRLNSSGSIDHTFGINGIAKGVDDGIGDVRAFQMRVGPNGNLYVTGEFNGWPLINEFTPAGVYINSAHLQSTGDHYAYDVGFSRNNVYMLADLTPTTEGVAAYDLNLKPDAGFGNNGLVVVTPLDHLSSNPTSGFTPGPIVVDPDGRIFASGTFNYQDGSGGDYAIAYLPDWGANTSVSGFIYNDANGNQKMDPGEAPLRYWQSFVDLNGNGVFDRYEPTAYTDYNGYYKIHGLDPGIYSVYEVLQPGWQYGQPSATPSHRFTVSSGQVSTGNDFGNNQLGYISGFVYYDTDGNGQDSMGAGGPSEAWIPNWPVYLDLNDNGIQDANEPTTTTNQSGRYLFIVQSGTYVVRAAPKPGWIQTQPAGGGQVATVTTGRTTTVVFGETEGNTLDPWFGNNGMVAGYTAQQVLPDGKILAHDSADNLVRLSPDGSIDSTFNPATDVPPTPLPGVYEPDGKRLVFDSGTRTITLYNADGSIDKTFGNNGSVTSYPQTPTRYLGYEHDPNDHPYEDTTFTPEFIARQGNDIIVAGAINGADRYGDPVSGLLGVERLNPNGSEDSNFGLVSYRATSFDAVAWQRLFVANGYQIYAAGTDADSNVRVVRLSPDGTSGIQGSAGDGDAVISGLAMGPDGRLVVVTLEGISGNFDEITRLNADLTPDPRLDRYTLNLPPGFWDPTAKSTFIVGDPFISVDGKVLVNVTYSQNQQTTHYLVRFSAEIPDGSGSISGFIYNDANGDGVHDSGDLPIRYAQAFVDLNGNGKFDLGEPTAYADYNGFYKIYGVAPGTYQVDEAPQSGYTQDAPSATPYRTVMVTAGNTATGTDFGNRKVGTTQLGSVSGTFFYDSNHNGAWDSGETISPYWGVYIDANNDGKFDSGDTEIIANGNGQFTFANLPAGTYVIRGTTASGWTQTFPANGGGQSVTVGSGQAVTGINIGEFHGTVSTAQGSISGTFFYDSNTNGTWDSGEAPSPYWGVYIDANNDGKYDTGDTELIANGAGQYTFSNLAAGTYIVRGRTASGWTQTFPANSGAQTVTVGSGQAITGINFGEFHGTVSTGAGSISGTFFYDSNHNGVWDSGEPISPYWGVYIDANNDGKFDSGDTELIANGNGQFTFPNLPAGTYVIRGTTASGWTQTFPANGGAQVVTLAAGQNLSNINFGEYHGIVSSGATGSISGTFFYDSNANGIWDSGETYSPSWGVYIDANDDGVYDSGDTELICTAHGQYTFSNLSAGTYVIRATTASGWKQTYPANGGAQVITLASGQNATGVNFGKVRT